MLRYGSQSIDEADIEAVVAVLRSPWLTQGPAVPAFEEAVKARCNAEEAVAVNSGTAALHLAYRAAGVEAGDRVWCPAITFAATANAARFCGAEISFLDINPADFNLCLASLERDLAQARTHNRLPKVVTVVHMAGLPADLEGLHRLAREYGFCIVEDACHALGGRHADGSPVGCGRWSDAVTFSFHPVKPITTGEGGMVLTGHADWAERMRLLRSHGITRDPARLEQASHGPWYYEQQELGYNYRLSDLQAALGMSQLDKLESFLERRRVLALRYREALAGLPLALQEEAAGAGRSGRHLLVIRLLEARHQAGKAALAEALHAEGIGSNLHYIPLYHHPDFHRDGTDWAARCPGAEQYYREALTLPLHQQMRDEDVDHVAGTLRRLLERDA